MVWSHLHVCSFAIFSVTLSHFLSVCLPANMPVLVCICVCMFVCVSVCLCQSLSICLYLSVSLYVCPSLLKTQTGVLSPYGAYNVVGYCIRISFRLAYMKWP